MSWHVIRDNGKTIYEVNGHTLQRRARQRAGGHQPIDQGWIDTGKWSNETPPEVEPPHSYFWVHRFNWRFFMMESRRISSRDGHLIQGWSVI